MWTYLYIENDLVFVRRTGRFISYKRRKSKVGYNLVAKYGTDIYCMI